MRKHTFTLVPLLAAALMLGGCSSDSTGNGGDALTSDEAYTLASELFALLEGIDIPLLDNPSASSSPAAVPYGDLYDDQIDVNQTCDGGGNATIVGTISGDVDPQTYDADLDVSGTADFAACGVIGETSTITVDGNPDIGLTGHILFTPSAGSASIEVDGQGNVSYETNDGRQGTCAVDLTATAALTASGVNQAVTGTMCGVDASTFDLQLITP